MVNLSIQLPAHFLEEQELSGYTVPASMKEVWAVELDLLAQVQAICEKYHIQYFASGGTLLGAVRHNGFIPWDDDIDITMLRQDYEKFCSHYKELKKPYELQFFGKTDGYLTGHAQLRNTETTAVLKTSLSKDYATTYCQGIFIDIFPLDAVPDDEHERNKFVKKLEKYKKRCNRVYHATGGYLPEKATLKRKVLHVLCKAVSAKYSYQYFHKKFLNECMKYNHTKTKYVSMLSFMPTNEKLYIKRSNLEHAVLHPFEFMQMPIEKNYDEVLKVQYGDYQTPLKDGSYHGGIIFHTDKAYKTWLNEQSK